MYGIVQSRPVIHRKMSGWSPCDTSTSGRPSVTAPFGNSLSPGDAGRIASRATAPAFSARPSTRSGFHRHLLEKSLCLFCQQFCARPPSAYHCRTEDARCHHIVEPHPGHGRGKALGRAKPRRVRDSPVINVRNGLPVKAENAVGKQRVGKVCVAAAPAVGGRNPQCAPRHRPPRRRALAVGMRPMSIDRPGWINPTQNVAADWELPTISSENQT